MTMPGPPISTLHRQMSLRHYQPTVAFIPRQHHLPCSRVIALSCCCCCICLQSAKQVQSYPGHSMRHSDKDSAFWLCIGLLLHGWSSFQSTVGGLQSVLAAQPLLVNTFFLCCAADAIASCSCLPSSCSAAFSSLCLLTPSSALLKMECLMAPHKAAKVSHHSSACSLY